MTELSRTDGQAKKTENSDNLPGKPSKGDIFKNIISKFEKLNVPEKMGKNENSGFHQLIMQKIY